MQPFAKLFRGNFKSLKYLLIPSITLTRDVMWLSCLVVVCVSSWHLLLPWALSHSWASFSFRIMFLLKFSMCWQMMQESCLTWLHGAMCEVRRLHLRFRDNLWCENKTCWHFNKKSVVVESSCCSSGSRCSCRPIACVAIIRTKRPRTRDVCLSE